MKFIFGGITALVGVALVAVGYQEAEIWAAVIGAVLAFTGFKVITS